MYEYVMNEICHERNFQEQPFLLFLKLTIFRKLQQKLAIFFKNKNGNYIKALEDNIKRNFKIYRCLYFKSVIFFRYIRLFGIYMELMPN